MGRDLLERELRKSGRSLTKLIKKGEIKSLMLIESLPKPINYTGGMEPQPS